MYTRCTVLNATETSVDFFRKSNLKIKVLVTLIFNLENFRKCYRRMFTCMSVYIYIELKLDLCEVGHQPTVKRHRWKFRTSIHIMLKRFKLGCFKSVDSFMFSMAWINMIYIQCMNAKLICICDKINKENMPILLSADLIVSHSVFNVSHLYVNVWELTKYAKKRKRPQGITSIYKTRNCLCVYVSIYSMISE